VKDNLRFWTW